MTLNQFDTIRKGTVVSSKIKQLSQQPFLELVMIISICSSYWISAETPKSTGNMTPLTFELNTHSWIQNLPLALTAHEYIQDGSNKRC